MRIFTKVTLSFICTLMFVGAVHAEVAPLKGIKLGFGFDRGFGIVGSMGKFNGFLGNDGVAVDYLFSKDKLKAEGVNVPMTWYVGAGGYGDWDGVLGVRLPVGLEMGFAKRVDGFAQIIPRLRVNNDTDFGLDFGIGVRYLF